MDQQERLAALGCAPSLTPDTVSSLNTPALLGAMRGLLVAGRGELPPGDAHPDGPDALWELFRACQDEVTARGLDADSLVRYGFHTEVLMPLLAEIVLKALVGEDLPPEVLQLPRVGAWTHIFALAGIRGRVTKSDLNDALSRLTALMSPWVYRAPMSDLFHLHAPTTQWLQDARGDMELGPEQPLLDYRWLVERNTIPELRHWHTESLYREVRWRDGRAQPPCPANVMDEVHIQRELVNAEISRRVVYAIPNGPNTLSSMSVRLQAQARLFLRQGRFAEAAALFEFGLRYGADSPDIVNNLGFCQLPTDPPTALFHLERAAVLGYRPLSINVFNRMVGHLAVGQARIARNLAEGYWATGLQDEPDPVPATLWTFGRDGELVLHESFDARVAICDVAIGLAGSKEERATWQARRLQFPI